MRTDTLARDIEMLESAPVDRWQAEYVLDLLKYLERTLATKEIEVTKLREFLARLFHYANNLDTDCCYTDKARPDCDLYGSGLWQEVEELLSTPITTEALDSYVAEKVKEAQEAVIQRVDVSIKGYMNAIDHFEATIKAFREHYLRAIECNEETHQDKPHCACSLVDLGWHESVDSAVGVWHAHVLEITNLPPLPAQPTEQPK